jgi:hypothetical protein
LTAVGLVDWSQPSAQVKLRAWFSPFQNYTVVISKTPLEDAIEQVPTLRPTSRVK